MKNPAVAALMVWMVRARRCKCLLVTGANTTYRLTLDPVEACKLAAGYWSPQGRRNAGSRSRTHLLVIASVLVTARTFSADWIERYCNQLTFVLALWRVLGIDSQLSLASAPHAGRADPRCGP